MATHRLVERIEEPAVFCRKCDRCMVGGTLRGARTSLCGGCANNDARAKTNRYMKRTLWQRRRDHFLDRWLPILFEVAGFTILAGIVVLSVARVFGWSW